MKQREQALREEFECRMAFQALEQLDEVAQAGKDESFDPGSAEANGTSDEQTSTPATPVQPHVDPISSDSGEVAREQSGYPLPSVDQCATPVRNVSESLAMGLVRSFNGHDRVQPPGSSSQSTYDHPFTSEDMSSGLSTQADGETFAKRLLGGRKFKHSLVKRYWTLANAAYRHPSCGHVEQDHAT